MRLTPNILLDASSFINCEGDRTLNLRSLSIPTIENLVVLRDDHQVIDLTDNDLVSLSNFPLLVRLTTILASNNRINTINSEITVKLPNLHSLCLINNSITSPSSLSPLHHFKHLQSLYLKDNPITSIEHYRLFLIFLVPTLQVIDFERVRDDERVSSKEVFGTFDDPSLLAETYLNRSDGATYEDKDVKQVKTTLNKLSEEDKERLKQELKNATSLAEIDRIENALKSGYL